MKWRFAKGLLCHSAPWCISWTELRQKLAVWKDSRRASLTRAAQDELKINPFLRVDVPEVQKFTGKTDPVDVIAALRSAKDSF